MFKKIASGLAVLAALAFLTGCAGMGGGPRDFEGKPLTGTYKPLEKVEDAPKEAWTNYYAVTLYPGTDENFDPNPTLTLQEWNRLSQFNVYCGLRTKETEGRMKEMLGNGVTYGVFQGIFTALGAAWGFGSAVQAVDYLRYAGVAGFGGGMASGTITHTLALRVFHGYCITMQVYKADRLEGKLSRVSVIPIYSGTVPMPKVSDKPEPTFRRSLGSQQPIAPPPPR